MAQQEDKFKSLIDELGAEFNILASKESLDKIKLLTGRLKAEIKAELAKGNVNNAKQLVEKMQKNMSIEETNLWASRLQKLYDRNK